MDRELFSLAVEAAKIVEKEQGIGTLSEGLLHSAVKYYFQPNPKLHEIKISGFVSDALVENYELGKTLLEVQTANFRNLRKKLTFYLSDGINNNEFSEGLNDAVNLEENTLMRNVTVVYPMPYEKRFVWISPETGEVSKGGKSPKKFVPAAALWELYSIRDFIGKSGFTFIILAVKVEEKRLLCGWSKDKKHGSRRVATIPIELCEELIFRSVEDYAAMLPEGLSEQFTCAEFSKKTKLVPRKANAALKCLIDIGLLERQKRGKEFYYFRRKCEDIIPCECR